MDLASILAQIVGGAVGGTAGGKIVKDSDLGSLGNLIAGAIGGLGGGTVLGSLLGAAGGAAAGGVDIGALAGQARWRRCRWSDRADHRRPDQEQARCQVERFGRLQDEMTDLAEGGASFGKALASIIDDTGNAKPEAALRITACR